MGVFYHRSRRLANFTHMPLRYVEAAKIADEGVTMGVVQALGEGRAATCRTAL